MTTMVFVGRSHYYYDGVCETGGGPYPWRGYGAGAELAGNREAGRSHY